MWKLETKWISLSFAIVCMSLRIKQCIHFFSSLQSVFVAWLTRVLPVCRLVYDRETGKPKGYGFCEYADQETAQSAMRNLNNHDFNGRPLRVGYAAGESSKDEMKGMQQAVGGMVLEVRAQVICWW